MVGRWKQFNPCPPQSTRVRKDLGVGAPGSRQDPMSVSVANDVSLSGAALAQGEETRPVLPAKGRRSCYTLLSWSSCGMWQCLMPGPSRVPGGCGLDWLLRRNCTCFGLSRCRDLLGEKGLKHFGKGGDAQEEAAWGGGCWRALEQTALSSHSDITTV